MRNTAEYKRLDRLIRRECTNAKEKWLNEKCGEIERLSNMDKNVMYSKVKELTGSPRNKSSPAIKKRDREVAMDREGVSQRWHEYTTELFNDATEPFELEVLDDGLLI